MVKPAEYRNETDLVKRIIEALNKLPGVHAMRLNSGRILKGSRSIKLCEPGTPDILVMMRGGFVMWLETKMPEGKLEESQKIWRASAANLGHRVYLVMTVEHAIGTVVPELDRQSAEIKRCMHEWGAK